MKIEQCHIERAGKQLTKLGVEDQHYIWNWHSPTQVRDELAQAFADFEAEIRKDHRPTEAALIEALRFYADNQGNNEPNEGPWGVNSTDFGQVARAALKKAGVE